MCFCNCYSQSPFHACIAAILYMRQALSIKNTYHSGLSHWYTSSDFLMLYSIIAWKCDLLNASYPGLYHQFHIAQTHISNLVRYSKLFFINYSEPWLEMNQTHLRVCNKTKTYVFANIHSYLWNREKPRITRQTKFVHRLRHFEQRKHVC